ncbi:MAG: Mur ligase family protein [Opitutales bacterium]
MRSLLQGVPACYTEGDLDCTVTHLTDDSRRVVPGSLFLACEPSRERSSAFLHESVAAGACAVLAERPPVGPVGVPWARVPGLEAVKAGLAARFYSYPDRAMSLIGVLGSERRAPVSDLVHYLLNDASSPTGLINHRGVDTGKDLFKSDLVTPGPVDLYGWLQAMDHLKRDNVVLEISTQGLIERRVQSLGFHALVFTDHRFDPAISRPLWPAVLEAKYQAFLEGGDLGRPDIAVINRNDPVSPRLIARMPLDVDVVTYGTGKDAHVRASEIRPHPKGWQFTLTWGHGRVRCLYPVPGKRHRVIEALAALATVIALEQDPYRAASRLTAYRDLSALPL